MKKKVIVTQFEYWKFSYLFIKSTIVDKEKVCFNVFSSAYLVHRETIAPCNFKSFWCLNQELISLSLH